MSEGERLVVERGRVVAFEDLPPRSLALDGYVQGPALDTDQRRFSFDHHDGCIRMVTRATCQQVMDALLLGLDASDLTVYINDVDGDTALSLWLLRNPGRIQEPVVRHLVENVGGIDAHGPSYPTLDVGIAAGFLAGPMEPEVTARQDGSYQHCDLHELLEECVIGIGDYVDAGTPPAPKRERVAYEVTHTGAGGWVLVHTNAFAFETLYADGHDRAISYRQLQDGSWAYTVARRSDLIDGFPVGPAGKEGTILHGLAAAEPGWGGGSSIGGSPRNADGSASQMGPDEVFALVEGVLAT